MNHASLFSGIGGFDLAAEWAGWTNVFNCEIDTFCQTVLKYHFPNAKQYSDIRATDFSVWRGGIDVLTGGFPCQPYSLAGKRKGTDDERHLWPEMLRAIREIRPRWVVGENVLGIVNWSGGLVFEQVCAELEAEGYEVQPYILPAAGVGAPHKRDRVWFVAHSCGNGRPENPERERGAYGEDKKQSERPHDKGEIRATSDRADTGVENLQERKDGVLSEGIVADPGGQQLQERPPRGIAPDREEDKARMDDRAERLGHIEPAADADCVYGRDLCEQESGQQEALQVDSDDGIRSWWADFPTQSPVCCGNDGLSYGLDGITFSKWRQESVKAYGNAIVTEVVYQIFLTINEY